MTDPPVHYLQIEGGTHQTIVVCTAGPGAPCHMVCPDCEESCTCGKPPTADMGECNWTLWLNEDEPMECGEGVGRLPINIEWTGDNYGWTFVTPAPRYDPTTDLHVVGSLEADGRTVRHPLTDDRSPYSAAAHGVKITATNRDLNEGEREYWASIDNRESIQAPIPCRECGLVWAHNPDCVYEVTP